MKFFPAKLFQSVLYFVLFLLSTKSTLYAQNKLSPPVSIYQFKLKAIDGQWVDFKTFKGKKILIVNVASKCGFTPQYAQLESLSKRYKDTVVVLGFPANNFFNQEPGSNQEIASFCQLNYGVSFPIFEKISVRGSNKHPLYKWLSDKSQNGWNSQSPSWNFCKYLIDEEGRLVAYFPSTTPPLSPDITNALK